MRIHPFTRLLIFSLLISVLGCVTAPKLTDIAELRYGDDESDIVEKFGRGSSVLYYDIDDTQYHYRAYTTRHTHDDYAMLFANGKLVSLLHEIPSFENCITPDALTGREKCLEVFTSQAHDDAIEIGTHDFSEGVDEQKRMEAENAKNTAVVAAVAVPSLVLTWPFAVMCGGIAAADQATTDTFDCYKILPEITEKTYTLLSRQTDESVIASLNAIYPDFVISIFDKQLRDRRIISKTWRCKRSDNLVDLEDVRVSIGMKSEKIVWMNLRNRRMLGYK